MFHLELVLVLNCPVQEIVCSDRVPIRREYVIELRKLVVIPNPLELLKAARSDHVKQLPVLICRTVPLRSAGM